MDINYVANVNGIELLVPYYCLPSTIDICNSSDKQAYITFKETITYIG